MIRTIRSQLISYVVGVMAIMLLAVGAAVYGILTRELDRAVDAQLRSASDRLPSVVTLPPQYESTALPGQAIGVISAERGDLLGDVYTSAVQGTFSTGLDPVAAIPFEIAAPEPVGDASDLPFIVHTVGGARLVQRGIPPSDLPDADHLALRDGESTFATLQLPSGRFRILAHRLSAQYDGHAATTVVGISLADRDRQQRTVVLSLAGGGILGLLVAGVGGYLVTSRALRPLDLAFERQRRFISDASHELRTPLTLVRAEAELLASRHHLTPEARPLLRHVDRTSRIADDLLTLARLDEQRIPLDREPVHAASLIREAAGAARMLAAPDVEVSTVKADEVWVHGDRFRLSQVLLILVDNACRVTPPGGRVIVAASEHVGTVVFTVTDTGPGIPEEHRSRIFERFYRVDEARSRASGGNGLGLSIAREIVEMHGGAIEVTCPSLGGTIVEFSLPAAPIPWIPEATTAAR